MFEPDELLLALRNANVKVCRHRGDRGWCPRLRARHARSRIVPDPDAENLRRLAGLLRELASEQVGVGEFSPEVFSYDPTDPDQLAQGANFRLETRLGPLDIMQWVAGIEEDPAYDELARGRSLSRSVVGSWSSAASATCEQ
jgi:hypothetical protein